MNGAELPKKPLVSKPAREDTSQTGGGTTLPLATWRHPVADIVRRGESVEREATPQERGELAAALGIPDVLNLKARYRLTTLGGDRYGLSGTLTADLVQTCIVTLDPLNTRIELTLGAEFRPDADCIAETAGDVEAEILELPDYEPIENGHLEVGRVAFETLAAGLDPYPRQAGSEFDWRDEIGAKATSPFAALAKLKRET